MAAQYQLIGGQHRDLTTGKVYHAGDIVESKDDLTIKFRGKFRRVVAEAPSEATDADSIQDVTDLFPIAEQKALTVLRQGEEFFVTRADKPDQRIHTETLTSATVAAFIASV